MFYCMTYAAKSAKQPFKKHLELTLPVNIVEDEFVVACTIHFTYIHKTTVVLLLLIVYQTFSMHMASTLYN